MSNLADAVVRWACGRLAAADPDAGPPLLLVSGAQGIGKSTAMAALSALEAPRIAVLGIDDFYLARADRLALAAAVHPLFDTRGPPGTHDLPLLARTLDALAAAGPEGATALPRFSKRADDRAPESAWPLFLGHPDAIVLEGWLLGAVPDADASTDRPLNPVEAEDRDGRWRAHQEAVLGLHYAELWDRAAGVLYLDAPGFEVVARWRGEQEETTLGLPRGTLPPERRAWVERFVGHYERITRRMLVGHRRPGDRIAVDAERRVIAASV